ncbi:MAG TPA: glycosyltransferase [Bryobacteraceae bacterium]|jgi:glycosyltransferase involved in cell wall biosynthesis
MRIAIVHYWLLGMRGGESVVESLCRMLPEADIFTLFYDPSRVSETIRSHRVTASYLNPLRRHYRRLLPLMPSALESFDLRGYDLVISSESGPAKGVLTQAATRHVCYCHTPMRYLWELYPAYLSDWTHSGIKRLLMRPLARNLRLWDFASAARVDHFIANSENVRRRIRKTYRRDSDVVHPPVAVETFYHRPPEDFFLMVSELVSYKQLDYAIRHFSRTGRRLRVAGDGPEYRSLKRNAGASVEFCGRVSSADLRELYACSRALVVPGEEDFGITMIEALASGKPVVALGRGGACEIVRGGAVSGGVLYTAPAAGDLEDALSRFDILESEFYPKHLQRRATRFSEAQFQAKMHRILAAPDPVGEPVPAPFA